MRLCCTFCFLVTVATMTLMIPAVDAPADEGMWLFNNPPEKLLKEKYHFEATGEWMEHLQRSSVRFNSGGSGSFVSTVENTTVKFCIYAR